MSTYSYGGQAVIEGVMIRGRNSVAVAVRRPNGEVVATCEPLPNVYTGALRKVPFLRGILVLVETMALGMRALMFSANIALEEENTPKDARAKESKAAWVMLPLGLVVGIGFFFVVPLLLTKLLHLQSPVAFAAVEGLVRVVFFVGYLGAVSLLPDMKRVFAYHGAEHMTIAAHEHGHLLDVEHIRQHPKEHPRCGTAFLITVMLVSILIFSLFGLVNPTLWMTVASRVVFIPIIAAVSYETIKFNAVHEQSLVGRIGMAPGIWLQWLTTRKPDDAQIEVAVAAMRTALVADDASPERNEVPVSV